MPSYFARLQNRAEVYYNQQKFSEAQDCYLELLPTRPDSASLWANIAACQAEQGKLRAAINSARRAIELDPDHVRAHITLGMMRLQLGNYTGGWPEYEWTGELSQRFKRLPESHRWAGEDLSGQVLLLVDEQGYGDSIQFVRFAQRLIDQGVTIYHDVKPPLRRLFQHNPHLGEALDNGESRPFTKWSRLLSVPRWLEVKEAELCPEMPYLKAPPLPDDSVIHSANGMKVGVIWRGSPANSRDEIRSVGISGLAPLLEISRSHAVSFFHLNYQSFAPEIEEAGLSDCVQELDHEVDDFCDLAAAINAMDLVICIDTAVAHLAGALGKECWCLTSHIADWRWGRIGTESPWYPNTKLYRQKESGNWTLPVETVKHQLINQLQGKITIRAGGEKNLTFSIKA
ncbi:MAG: tetratricopeptide repeat protein [Verrucomicrobiota bacterium]